MAFFKKRVQTAGKAFLSYAEEGFQQGRRKELVGGGLIRSLGGWSEVKRLRSEGRAHMMSDERILGESDFVDSMLSDAGEDLDRRYDLGRIATRAAEIFEMGVLKFFSKRRQVRKINARSLTCFWAARELGMSLADLGRVFETSIPGIGYAVERGETLAHNIYYQLINSIC